MNISVISGTKGMLDELLTKSQESQQLNGAAVGDAFSLLDFSQQQDKVEFSPSALARSRNMMSQNFVGGKVQDTKYLDSQLAGATSVQSLQNAMSASLMSSISPDMSSLAAAASPMGGDVSSISEDISEAMFYNADPRLRNAKLLKDTTDAHREYFAEQKDELETKAEEAIESKAEEALDSKDEQTSIEAKAEEAMAPKDENGEPIEQPGQATKNASSASNETKENNVVKDSKTGKTSEEIAEEVAKDIEASEIKLS